MHDAGQRFGGRWLVRVWVVASWCSQAQEDSGAGLHRFFKPTSTAHYILPWVVVPASGLPQPRTGQADHATPPPESHHHFQRALGGSAQTVSSQSLLSIPPGELPGALTRVAISWGSSTTWRTALSTVPAALNAPHGKGR